MSTFFVKLPLLEPYGPKASTAINKLIDGKNNATGSVTLTANTTTTTLTNPLISKTTVVFLMATTANAATATANVYHSATADGSLTLTHANNAQTDRTFNYLLTGV